MLDFATKNAFEPVSLREHQIFPVDAWVWNNAGLIPVLVACVLPRFILYAGADKYAAGKLDLNSGRPMASKSAYQTCNTSESGGIQ